MALSKRQQAFVDEYCAETHPNITQAAIRAGYSERTAYAQGSRLLKHVEVKAAVDAKLARLSRKTELNAEWVLRQFRERAEDPDEVGATRIRAAELVGKHLGLFTEKVEVTANLAQREWDGDDG